MPSDRQYFAKLDATKLIENLLPNALSPLLDIFKLEYHYINILFIFSHLVHN